MDYQRLLLDHLDLIARIVRTTGRRQGLSMFERQEFASFVNLRLVENEYAILRKFQGRSTLRTYLGAVIQRLSIDFCGEKWGRWRPSRAAKRLGAEAIGLERLVHRDGHTLDEASEMMRTNYGIEASDDELRAIWEQLPDRVGTTDVGESEAEDQLAVETADMRIEDEARKADVERLDRALRSAFDDLPAKDKVMLALRFDHDLSIAEIAKALQSSVTTQNGQSAAQRFAQRV